MCLGRIILCSSLISPLALKDSNDVVVGGYMNGREPKLNRHCWNDMKLAAAKNPDLDRRNTCARRGNRMNYINMYVCVYVIFIFLEIDVAAKHVLWFGLLAYPGHISEVPRI
jgi:hypothetical protein